MHNHLVECLVLRMRILDTLNSHPEILAEPVDAPIIILGLPRTGTTKLQRCLAATGNFQTLPLWKIINPLPLPSDPPGTDTRLAIAERVADTLKQAYPRFYAAHPMLPTEPDEEALLMEPTFLGETLTWISHLPAYSRWVQNQNIQISYQWLKQVLQLLQWQDETERPPRQWLLKSPVHIGRLDEIFAVFPDAVIVHCHRDLCSSIPSAAGLAEAMWRLYSDSISPEAAGRFALDLALAMDAYIESRARWEGAGKCFVDIQFDDIVNDINGVTHRTFTAASQPFNEHTADRLATWESENPPHKHGLHDYDSAYFGLSEKEIKQRFSAYLARFS